MGEVEVTVAVPVKDRKDQMERCLEAALALDHPSFEVLVVDNGSTDGTKEMVLERARSAKVPVRLEEVPGSVGRVRNEAARLARGEVIAFTDSDCLPEPQWLTAGLRPFADDARVGIVCGPTLPEHAPAQGWAATQDIAGFSGRFETCNVLFRRSAFLEGEGFAEDGFGWEDTAGAYAVKRRGWKVAFAPEAVVRHDVTYPGFWWHVRRQRIHLQIAQMVRDYPEVRRELLFAGVFMNERHAKFVGFVVGLALAKRFPPAILLTIPYWRFLAQWQITPRSVAQGVLYDGATTVNVLRSAVRYRRFVL
ncbi:glycosyltransferase family 2 protein [Conexibacter sp. SYSU D00693]|uniref:glycosyltransferase n=1 Tax=Conexibacter sp. SYSU D00693 TaxID=2812560 RepID=UPI00196B9262|nr:glycosyltransferase family A protein [Conexibacter sp. SYSU D00693]